MLKKNIITTILLCLAPFCAWAGDEPQGLNYFLPKTALQVQVRIEKRTFTPGRLAAYSERYLRKACQTTPSVTYRVVGVDFYPTAVPDTSRHFTLPLNKKLIVLNIDCDKNGVLMAVNDKGETEPAPKPFVAAHKAKPLNPDDFMTADILAAGSEAKMAELTAQEIYDIRDSRNQINRGESDEMPKDGAQLRLMLDGLQQQETALLQLFDGTTDIDTTETIISYVPEKGRQDDVLFRFSTRLGLLDADDLGGAPYYVRVNDLGEIQKVDLGPTDEKKKEEPAFYVVLPSLIQVAVTDGAKPLCSKQLYAAQFGSLQGLPQDLFSKKQTTHIVLSPVTGAVKHLQIQPLK